MGVESPEPSDADFTYDYELIRRGGLIFAAVLFCLGMVIIFSKKLRCGKSSATHEDNGDL
ncbi:sodium/potassium-transporting ATPase subunit gamma [Danio aesculapii]|uniref:sodium/potassium-transporting ATPase subunit gamma n=1 Tax=Danio aesculapii TaxID=1142201 RepID=UPI0024C05F94|nr:sodium/potassium-transporting ATPase subunit gamma [Danio aesculapii]XP_056312984.1 sodium/potassium-transporting ATPase subunit gamma [Danio aesculapii]